MIPLRDNIPSRRFPLMTVLLIIANILIFFYETSLPLGDREALVQTYGLVPREITDLWPSLTPDVSGNYLPLVTAMFLHAGWLHVLGNMLFLWVFADNVEDLLGSGRFLVFYLSAGLAGNLAHLLANPASTLPTVGASGAVAGVLGAYMITFPRARVLTLVPILFFVTTAEIPAVFFLAFWFLLQLASGVASLGVSTSGGVAWWAHIGGFIAGAILMTIMRERRYVR